jgi:hypothetical protein
LAAGAAGLAAAGAAGFAGAAVAGFAAAVAELAPAVVAVVAAAGLAGLGASGAAGFGGAAETPAPGESVLETSAFNGSVGEALAGLSPAATGGAGGVEASGGVVGSSAIYTHSSAPFCHA